MKTLRSNVRKATGLSSFLLLFTVHLCFSALWEGADDFSSGISAANWTVFQTNHGQMTVQGTNGHASFIVTNSTTAEQNAYFFWNGTPTAAEDWTVDITGHNSAPFSSEGSSLLQLVVLDTESITNPPLDGYTVTIRQGAGLSGIGTVQWHTNGYPVRVAISNTNVLFGMRLVYHSAGKYIEAWYDPDASGVDWTWLDTISLTDFSPGMTTNSTFAVGILSDTSYGPITEGEIWADNFRITNAVIVPTSILALPQMMLNGQFRFNLLGSPGCSYTIQVSTNLQNWDSLTNLLVTNSITPFTDLVVTNFNRRFYRAVLIDP